MIFLFLYFFAESQPFSPTSSSNTTTTSSAADSNSSSSSTGTKTFVACKVCGDKASGKWHHRHLRLNIDFIFFSISSCRLSLRCNFMWGLQGEQIFKCRIIMFAVMIHLSIIDSNTQKNVIRFIAGIFPSQHPKANRISLFERWQMLGNQTEPKPMPIL